MGYVPASRNAHEHRLYLQNMKTTFNQSDLDTAGTVRASGEPVLRSTWLLLAIAVLVVTGPSEEGRAQLLTGTR
jgi:hypothetical protein